MYIKWKCKCGKVFISNTRNRHELDKCNKCGMFVDAEWDYTRASMGVEILEEYDYDFLLETYINAKEQGIDFKFIKEELVWYIPIRTLSDEARGFEKMIMRSLK